MKGLEAELGRHLVLIAESDLNDPRIVRSREIGGYGIDAQWADDFHHALHVLLTGERSGYYCDFGGVSQLAKALQHAFVYDGEFSRYRQRPHGRSPQHLPAGKFVVCTQNHDQVGNRAQGERLCHLVSSGKAKTAAALLLTSPFVPMIFQGEEWAASTPFLYFTQHLDAELGRKVSEGRRREFSSFGWAPEEVPDPQAPSTFERSRLDWHELSQAEHAEMLAWYRNLIRLRQSTPDLRTADANAVEVQFSESEKWLLMRRGRIMVACNFGVHAWHALVGSDCDGRLIASTGPSRATADGVVVPPESAVILGDCAESRPERVRAEYAGGE